MSNFCSITTNGKTIKCSGNNVAVIDGNIIVDGKVIDSSITNNTRIVINGDVGELECDGFVEVYGNTGSIYCGGSCTVSKDVCGSIKAGESVKCRKVSGGICAGGRVQCKNNIKDGTS